MEDTLFIFGAKYFFLLAAVIAAAWLARQPKEIKKQFVIFACICLPLAYILTLIANHSYTDLRPFVVGNFTPLIPHAADNGFPSDHTVLVATIAALFYFFNKRLSGILWSIAIIVGFSRVYVGVHHPIDILGSIVIAIIAAIVTHYILSFFRHYRKIS